MCDGCYPSQSGVGAGPPGGAPFPCQQGLEGTGGQAPGMAWPRCPEAGRIPRGCAPRAATRGQPPSAGWTVPASSRGLRGVREESPKDLVWLAQGHRFGLGRTMRMGQGLLVPGLEGRNRAGRTRTNPNPAAPPSALSETHLPQPWCRAGEGLGICSVDPSPSGSDPAGLLSVPMRATDIP